MLKSILTVVALGAITTTAFASDAVNARCRSDGCEAYVAAINTDGGVVDRGVKQSQPTTIAVSSDALNGQAKQVQLKDGSTVYVFKDGKMAMQSKLGLVQRMHPGVTMEAKDGQKIVMTSDEVARLSLLIGQDNGS